MSNPTLEIGQILFSSPPQGHTCPAWVIAFIEHIGSRMENVMWNRNQEQYKPPFSWGGYWKHDVFEIVGYRYPDDTPGGKYDPQLYNFKWRDVEISWYKHLGRGTTITQEIAPEYGIQMLNECLAALDDLDSWLKPYLHGKVEHPAHRETKPEMIAHNEFDFRTDRSA